MHLKPQLEFIQDKHDLAATHKQIFVCHKDLHDDIKIINV